MTALTTPAESAQKLLTELRDTNAANALIAARAMTPIVERLAIEGQQTPDLDLARKMLESLQKVAVHPERQDAANKQAAAAQAILTIVLDDTPQASPKKRPRSTGLVEDAVEIVAMAGALPAADPVPELIDAEPAWGLDL